MSAVDRRLQRVGPREFRVTLFPGPRSTEYRVIAVVYRHGERTFRTVAAGQLPRPVAGGRGLLTDLARVVWELRRQWHVGWEPEAPREPLGGGGGDQPLPGVDGPLEYDPTRGLPLDADLADLYNLKRAPSPPQGQRRTE